MNFKRVIAALCTAFMIVASVAVSAAESNIELVFEDVTSSDAPQCRARQKLRSASRARRAASKLHSSGSSLTAT